MIEWRYRQEVLAVAGNKEEGHSFEKATIQWHPGFYSAAELELISNKDALAFEREYNLSKAPLRMDLLIIKKLADVRIENEIGRIFKRYNVYICSD
nr:hypothetical protein [uncultured Acetatifactor sp.]